MNRDTDRNDLHPEVVRRRMRTTVGLVMMVGGGALGAWLATDGTLGMTEAVFSTVFMTWGGILVDPKTFRLLTRDMLKASPWSNDKEGSA